MPRHWRTERIQTSVDTTPPSPTIWGMSTEKVGARRTSNHFSLCVCVCVRACVREREREREIVCVCVCVSVSDYSNWHHSRSPTACSAAERRQPFPSFNLINLPSFFSPPNALISSHFPPCLSSYRSLICCSLCVFLQKPYLLFPVCVPTETSSAVPCMCSAETSSAVPCMCSAETSSAVPCVCSYRNLICCSLCVCSYRNLICCSLCVCSAETSSAVSALCRRGREGEQVGWSEVGGGVLWDSG